MDKKYQIISANTVIPMIVSVNNEEWSELLTLSIQVDYFGDHVYFDDKTLNIDYDDLEQEILCYLRPPTVEAPVISPDLLKKISDVQSGNYGGEFSPKFQEFNKQ